MAIDMFMKVEGVSGESKDANHKDWTNVDSFEWGAIQPGSMTKWKYPSVRLVASKSNIPVQPWKMFWLLQ